MLTGTKFTCLTTVPVMSFDSELTKQTCSDKIILNANLMQQGDFIDVFLARHVSGTHVHHQEH